ncbi:protein undicht [Arctopsyche grandis]|uniref:protein undicht n=1 Tax=Arctopsyche grandis TaxID=121162 RepID=UPI00406D9770
MWRRGAPPLLLLLLVNVYYVSCDCTIPVILRNTWFSWENGKSTLTEINGDTMSRRGSCVAIKDDFHVNYTMVLKHYDCYYCVKLLVRTVNVLEKIETPCVDLARNEEPTVERVCRGLNADQQLITLFSENYVPINCRSSLEGVWQFAYQNRFRFTGECDNPDAYIRSCQTAGTQFLITNQKFNITYKSCPGMSETFDGTVEYSCLGDWFVDKNHYFAVANTKESRKDEKYRCFLKNRDDDLYIGVSITAECNTLKTPEKSPERMRITPVKAEVVEPGCRLPQNFSGDWINTANLDADVFINETHIIETWYPDEGRYRRTIYVCREQRDSRIMMARLTVDGCQKDYVCFDFVPQHHNIIRYRRGLAVIKDDFHTVCSWVQFPNKEQWKYSLFLAKNPVAVRCPVAGKFNFTQKGDVPFETRILGGVTLSPRPNIYCKENISDFSVCDTDQKEIAVDEDYCLSVDHLGRPVDIYSDPDYKMKCIGFWKENLKSYLITYDELDAFSKYRCWVYQRSDLNRVLMSQALGAFCDIRQDVTSWNYTEGAAVALEMEEYERERDQCPMHFDDGSNPWMQTENYIKVFTYGYWGSSPATGLSDRFRNTFYLFSFMQLTTALLLRYL